MDDKKKKEIASRAFHDAVMAMLEAQGAKDKLFAKTLEKENKNIQDCVQYIVNTVKSSGRIGFTDDEILQMAMHYYDEDKIDIGKPVKDYKVVVNGDVKLTEEEIAEAKREAVEKLISSEMERMRKKPKKEPEKTQPDPTKGKYEQAELF